MSPFAGQPGIWNYVGRKLERYPNFCNYTGLNKKRTYDPHMTYRQIEKIIPETELQKLYKFCISRNPFDRAYSYYLHAINKPKQFNHKLITDYGSFDTMLRHLEEVAEPSQTHFIVNHKNEIAVDFIGRFENLNEDFNAICSHLEIDFFLPKLNARKHGHFTEMYNESNWKYVADYYAEDFETFGYEKDFLKLRELSANS